MKNHIWHSIDILRKGESLALKLDPENGYYLAFSGGKDSQVLYHLAKEAGVKFKAHFSLTSCDHAEVIRFVRANYPDVELIKPKSSIYQKAKEKRSLPSPVSRWCCSEYKEIHGAGKVTLIGVRREESFKRSRRQELEILSKDGLKSSFDQFEEHREVEDRCVSNKSKIIVSPILEWTEKDVWSYLNNHNIPHCKLYDMGYKRVGCMFCPMQNKQSRKLDYERYPHIWKLWQGVFEVVAEKGEASAKDIEKWFYFGGHIPIARIRKQYNLFNL